jgi:ribosomal protein L29
MFEDDDKAENDEIDFHEALRSLTPEELVQLLREIEAELRNR